MRVVHISSSDINGGAARAAWRVHDSLRLVVNEGQPFTAVLPQAGILAEWGGISFMLSLKLFRWQ